ncbi:MAG: hypothetical protein AAFR18_03895 [Cyanobacteria bacterium J06627_32]
MQIKPFVTVAVLSWLLGACAVTLPPEPSAERGSGTGEAAGSTETSAAASCEMVNTSPQPLATPTNAPAFEQFNFQPQEIAIANNTVTIATPHHIFSLCQTDGAWSITSADASEDALGKDDFSYERMLAEMANPTYETIEVAGESYQYRVRLQAEWLSEQQQPPTTNPELTADERSENIAIADEDAVFFELKTPSGDLISKQIYTLSELQNAQLGASLGAPSIAGAVTVGPDIWFAASSSQGEGDNGFASLLRYSTQTDDLTVEQPTAIQGDQITSLVATGDSTGQSGQPLTLWFGTQRSGEGVPYYPASGLVSYQPETKALNTYTIADSPLVGAIPYELAVDDDALWVATREGLCQAEWTAIDESNSWDCWRFTATAALPPEGVDLYSSFLSADPATTLQADSVEVLWVNQSFGDFNNAEVEPTTRYEVVYEPGFETALAQGGYRITNPVALRASGGKAVSWPGSQWHWSGDRFERSLDEVALNLVGGGPYGLVDSTSRSGFNFDNNAIRGDFDLLSLTNDETKVRYYSGWVEGDEIEVYPTVKPVEPPAEIKPNPLVEKAENLTVPQGP